MTSDANGNWVKWEDTEHIIIQRDHAIVVVKETMGKMTKQAYDNVENENALKETVTKLRKRVELLSRAGNELSRRLWLHDFQANSQYIHNWEDAKYGEIK
jgi:hypothetical protein